MTQTNHLIERLQAASRGRETARFAELPDGREVSYAALFEAASKVAGALAAAGVVPGDRVTAQVEKSLAALHLYLGTVMAGAVFQPLNTSYTPAEVGYFLADAEPAVLVCDPRREPELSRLPEAATVRRSFTLDAAGEGTLADAARAAAPMTPVPCGPDDLAAILYTSGTTGRSKGAMLSHENLASNSGALVSAWRFTPDDVLIHALPIFHTHGLFVATNVTLMAGASVILMPRFDADAIIAALPRATAMMGVPTFYTRLLAHSGLDRAVTANMRLFVSGSAPLLAETHRQWEAATGHRILERYGMTETNMIASNPYEGERRPGAVGFALPDVSLRIADPETGQVLPAGEIGGIEVRGPNVFKGYWRMPEKTAQEFRPDGFFVTGDLGRVDADGYLSIVGRSKDLIISGGYNVYPKEVEVEIDALPGILESAVIGLPHDDFGEAVAAVVVPQAGGAPTAEAIVAALAGRLAKFKQPKRIFLADALPRNAMGKVQKAELRKLHADAFAGQPNSAAEKERRGGGG